MKVKRFSLSLLCALGFFLNPAAWGADSGQLPSLGDASSGIISLEEERRLGESFKQDLRRRLTPDDDILMFDYVENYLYRLAAASELSDRRLSLFLIDNPQLNAFAAPGGVIGINLGLFLHARNEHEFGAVLAHELAHLSQRHYARSLDNEKRDLLPYLAGILASAVVMSQVGVEEGIAGVLATQANKQAKQLGFSRSVEQEADRLGIRTLAKAGANPEAMAGMFQEMSRASRFSRNPPEFLLTHPVTESRISDARAQARQYRSNAAQEYRSSPDYPLMRIRAQVRLKFAPELCANYKSALRKSPSPSDRYGAALCFSRNHQDDEALETIQALVTDHPSRLLYRLTEAEILIRARRVPEALHLLTRESRLNPDNRVIERLYAETLIQDREFAKALKVLEKLSDQWPDNVQLQSQIADTAGLSQNFVKVHLARAEYFRLRGEDVRAYKQLEFALDKIEGDNYFLTALINQRMENIKAEATNDK